MQEAGKANRACHAELSRGCSRGVQRPAGLLFILYYNSPNRSSDIMTTCSQFKKVRYARGWRGDDFAVESTCCSRRGHTFSSSSHLLTTTCRGAEMLCWLLWHLHLCIHTRSHVYTHTHTNIFNQKLGYLTAFFPS